jgi:hypothetical protein
MEQHKNGQPQGAGTNAQNGSSAEQGRKPDAPEQSTSEQTDDISYIDQQEGQMNNGELGGNFDMGDTGSA